MDKVGLLREANNKTKQQNNYQVVTLIHLGALLSFGRRKLQCYNYIRFYFLSSLCHHLASLHMKDVVARAKHAGGVSPSVNSPTLYPTPFMWKGGPFGKIPTELETTVNFGTFESDLDKICATLNISNIVKAAAKSLLLASECVSYKYNV
jgi:hypothetical protein